MNGFNEDKWNLIKVFADSADIFNPERKSLHGLQTEFLKSIANLTGILDCETNNHQIGWNQDRTELLCVRCNISLGTFSDADSPSTTKIVDDAIRKCTNEIRKINQVLKKLINEQYHITTISDEDIANYGERFKGLEIWPKCSEYDAIRSKLNGLASCKKGFTIFDKSKHTIQNRKDLNQIKCAHCGIVLLQLTPELKNAWKKKYQNRKERCIRRECIKIATIIAYLKSENQRSTYEMWMRLLEFLQLNSASPEYKHIKKVLEEEVIENLTYYKMEISKTVRIEEIFPLTSLKNIQKDMDSIREDISQLSLHNQDLELLLIINHILNEENEGEKKRIIEKIQISYNQNLKKIKDLGQELRDHQVSSMIKEERESRID